MRNSSGSSKRRGSRPAAPFSTITHVPAGMSTPPTVTGVRDRRKSPLTGLSKRRHSSTNPGIRSLSSRRRCWMSLRSAMVCSAVPSSRTVVSCPAEKRLAATRTTSIDLGHRAVGEGRRRQARQHVLARLAPAVLDVGGEPVVEELERRVGERPLAGAPETLCVLAVAALQLVAEPRVVLLGHAEQVGDDVEGEWPREVTDEFALATLDELVDLAVGVPPHEVLVLAQPLRGDQPHQQAAVRLMHRVVHDGDLVAERQLVAVVVDEVADVVALERHREPGERARHGVARRERGGVRVDRDRLLVPRHHDDVVVRSPAEPGISGAGGRSRGTGPRPARCPGRNRCRRTPPSSAPSRVPSPVRPTAENVVLRIGEYHFVPFVPRAGAVSGGGLGPAAGSGPGGWARSPIRRMLLASAQVKDGERQFHDSPNIGPPRQGRKLE